MLKRALLSAAAGLMAIGGAQAADMPVKAPVVVASNWSGFYVGLGAGFRSANADATVTSLTNDGVPLFNCANLVFFGGCITSEPFNDTALRLSPYVGANWQFAPQWLVGIEADVGLANRSTTLRGMRYPAPLQLFSQGNEHFSVGTGWDASVRARLGFVPDPAILLYATGGPAWLRIASYSACGNQVNQDCNAGLIFPNGPAVINHATTKLGWTAGAGIEAKLTGNLIGRAEYRYSDFGTVTNVDSRITNGVTLTVATYDVRMRTHTGTLGLAYKFGDPGVAASSSGLVGKAPVAVASSWSGFYLGIGGGARAGTYDPILTRWTNGGVNFLTGACPPTNAFAWCDLPMGGTAARVSAYAGYNWQISQLWVLGAEADFGWGKKKTTLNGFLFPNSAFGYSLSNATSFSVETSWDASIRGRIGVVPMASVLAYVTGGASWIRVSATSNCFVVVNAPCVVALVPGVGQDFGLPITITDATTKLGWTLGGGLEGKITKNLIARGEYRYANYGTITNTDTRVGPISGTAQVVSYDLKVRTHTMTLGLAYLFDGGPVIAKY